MKHRTEQDLLAERRANITESMRESNRIAKDLLLAHVATIDAELQYRRDNPVRQYAGSPLVDWVRGSDY